MIERNASPAPEGVDRHHAVLHQPVEPIICWIDCHETDPASVAPLRGTLELVLTLICCIVLAGFALANFAQDTAASGPTHGARSNFSDQRSSKRATPDVIITAHASLATQ